MTQTISQAVSALATLVLAGLGIWGAIELNPWFQLQQIEENLAKAQVQLNGANKQLKAVQLETAQLKDENSALESQKATLEDEKDWLKQVTNLALGEISEKDEALAESLERNRNLALENDRLKSRLGVRRGAAWVYACSIYTDAVRSNSGGKVSFSEVFGALQTGIKESAKFSSLMEGGEIKFSVLHFFPETLEEAFIESETAIPAELLSTDHNAFKSSIDEFLAEHNTDMGLSLRIPEASEGGISGSALEKENAALSERLQKAAEVVDSFSKQCLEANPGTAS